MGKNSLSVIVLFLLSTDPEFFLSLSYSFKLNLYIQLFVYICIYNYESKKEKKENIKGWRFPGYFH